jgi:hypothetical protein
MSLPSTVSFAAGDVDYITKLNQIIEDFNLVYAAFLATQTGQLFAATSATSWTVGNGSKAFTLTETTVRAFAVGQTVRVSSSASPANYGEGQITAYDYSNPAAQVLTVNITSTAGSGTLSSWSIGVASPSAAITAQTVGSATADQFIMVNSAGSAIIGQTAPLDGISDPAFWMGAQ